MAVTNYATINGQILYESTSGVRIEYVHDALGSVTATTDSSRTVQNAYRWAGYGTQIAKTGTAADPKFQWNGTSGYRAASRAHASQYVRRRHYGGREGSWSSVDLNWLLGGAYGYCYGRPIVAIDFTGQVAQRMITDFGFEESNPVPCNGKGTVRSAFRVADENGKLDTKAVGWIIQKISIISLGICCGIDKSGPIVDCGVNQGQVVVDHFLIGYGFVFYEAWWVDKGVAQDVVAGSECKTFQSPASGYNDHWDSPEVACFHGYVSTKGELAFVSASDNKSLPLGLVCGGATGSVPCSHLAPSASALTSNVPFGQGVATAFYAFSCCNGEEGGCTHCPVDKAGCVAPPTFRVSPSDGGWH